MAVADPQGRFPPGTRDWLPPLSLTLPEPKPEPEDAARC